MENIRIKLVAVVLATSVVLGAGIAITPTAAAQPNPEAREERLQMMVEDGVITEERADEIRARMAERAAQRAERQTARQTQRDERLEELATTLGTTADDLKSELQAGTSLAEIATAAGVDIETVIDQIEATMTDRINEAVIDGHIDQERADTQLEELRERITARVNGERPDRPEGPPRFRHSPHFRSGN